MVEKDLKQIKQLMREAEDLRYRADNLKASAKAVVSDTAKDYKTGKGRTIVITGHGDENFKKLRDRYYKAYIKRIEQIKRIENEIQEITDPEMRYILRRYYFDDVSQEDIADEIGYTQQTVSNRINNFWEEYNKDFEIDDE